ncbi:MAG: 3-oxoacyl-[acyl-carrier-protein] reductase FabG [Candidatus Omnitrophica bacterium]|nr:3-oxoacyl-[acyl-carrier-protein] reductase FabG [Candidatus Omnitrophota bacterium]
MTLQGRTILVTGAAKRVGHAIALCLAGEGARIIVHHRSSPAEAERALSDIRSAGGAGLVERADLSDAGEVRALVERLDRAGTPVDALVNSASIFHPTPLETVDEAQWDAFQDANLRGPFLLSTLLGLRMRSRGWGRIVNIADWSGLRPYRGYVPYCVSKGGLITLTKALARDLAPSVLVNAVAPGPVLPPPDMPAEERERAAARTLVGRWGSPGDIASAVKFVLSSTYLNGTVLCVDGGRSIA